MSTESEEPNFALASKEAPDRAVFSILTCIGDEFLRDMVREIVQSHFAGTHDVTVTDRHQASTIADFVGQHRVDLIAAMVNNIETANAGIDDRILTAAQLLGRLKAQHGVPVIAFSGYFPESFNLPEELRKNGIHTFFPAPFDAETFLKGLRDLL